MSRENKEILLSVRDLSITYGHGKKRHTAVKKVNFDIYRGETFSLVGESGSGKTTIGRAIIGLNNTSNGDIIFQGQKINTELNNAQKSSLIQKIQMIFQDPLASLNERATVEYIISEGLCNFQKFKTDQARLEKVEKIIQEVGLLPEHLYRYPHEFSGGQRQRIGIARALIMKPELIIGDEPVSALDVSIRAQILNLLRKFQQKYQLTYFFISHDLSVVRFISDRIAVIRDGQIVELAETEELFANPLHPYTKSLLSAVPIPDPILARKQKLVVYDPSVHQYDTDEPIFYEIRKGHFVYGNQQEIAQYEQQLAQNSAVSLDE